MPSDNTFQGQTLTAFFLNLDLPLVKGYNRLEARPRRKNFDRSLRCEIRDPLWMLTRQWQMGEFLANDAGSPAKAKVQIQTTAIDGYRTGPGPGREYDDDIPLETRVEAEAPPLTLALRVQIGRHFLKLTESAGLSRDYRADFTGHAILGVQLPDRDPDHHEIYAHQPVWQLYAALAGRCLDGGELLMRRVRGDDPLAGVSVDSAEDAGLLNTCLDKTLAWFERTYNVPLQTLSEAWKPSHLEYQFSCQAPGYQSPSQYELSAREYHQGHLDWYNFDLQRSRHGDASANDARTFEFIPTHIQFGGMPNLRWWEFENRKTHFGDIDAQTTDLAKLMLIEFGLIYADDWFLVPFELPVGKMARVSGLVVSNVFNERFWIPAAADHASDWNAWAMYQLSHPHTHQVTDRSLFLPPAVDRLMEGQPVEKVQLIRDEMANMVWGIESTLLMADGQPCAGAELSTQRKNYFDRLSPPASEATATDPQAAIKYTLMTGVPEHWIPFIPVRMPEADDSSREIQLQRAVMMRRRGVTETDQPVRPGSGVLAHNLPAPYFIHEEEVPRSGIVITRSYQRARWHDGSVFLWLGRRKRTGRGEGSSGLRFDQIDDLPQQAEERETPPE